MGAVSGAARCTFCRKRLPEAQPPLEFCPSCGAVIEAAVPAPPTAVARAGEPPAKQGCCTAPDARSARRCDVCGTPICRNCRYTVDTASTCEACARDIARAHREEKAGPARLIPGFIGGAAGALVGGGVWAAIAILRRREVGSIAILVGFLAGLGVVLGAGRKKGWHLQAAAVICTLAGLIAGRYVTVVHFVKERVRKVDGEAAAAAISYLSGQTMTAVMDVLLRTLSPFDALWAVLWAVLAMGLSWLLPGHGCVEIRHGGRRIVLD